MCACVCVCDVRVTIARGKVVQGWVHKKKQTERGIKRCGREREREVRDCGTLDVRDVPFVVEWTKRRDQKYRTSKKCDGIPTRKTKNNTTQQDKIRRRERGEKGDGAIDGRGMGGTLFATFCFSLFNFFGARQERQLRIAQSYVNSFFHSLTS